MINILTTVIILSVMLNILLFVRYRTVRKERDVANAELHDILQKLFDIQHRLQGVGNTKGRIIDKLMHKSNPRSAILLKPTPPPGRVSPEHLYPKRETSSIQKLSGLLKSQNIPMKG